MALELYVPDSINFTAYMYINFIVVFYFDVEEMWRNYRFYFWKCVHLYINCKLLLQIGSSFSVFILWTRHIHLTHPAREHSITKRINNLPTHTHTHFRTFACINCREEGSAFTTTINSSSVAQMQYPVVCLSLFSALLTQHCLEFN